MAHACHVYPCGAAVPPRMLMCRRHWALVPKDMQDAVYAAFTPGQCDRRATPTREWLKAARAAISWVEQQAAAKEGK